MTLSYSNPFMPPAEIYTGIISIDFEDEVFSEKPMGFAVRSAFDPWLLNLLII